MKVKCVDDRGWELTVGRQYEVLEEENLRYKIKSDEGKFLFYDKNLFEIVEENKMKVKCVNNQNSQLLLTVGKEYEVLNADTYAYRVRCDAGQTYWYCKEYFEIVEENKMKVKCVDNASGNYPLTIGKEYEAKVSSFGGSYTVVDDNDKSGGHFKWRFVPVGNITCNKESTIQSLITKLNALHKELEVCVIIHDWGYFINSWFGEFKVETEQDVLEALNEMLKLVSKYKGENDDNG